MSKVRELISRYHRRLDDAETRDDILEVLLSMDDGYVRDTLERVQNLSDDEFEEFRLGLAYQLNGSKNSENWYEKYLDIMIPKAMAHMIIVSMGKWDGSDGVVDDGE